MSRGFAAMPPERRREIAAAAGRRAHELGVAHKWTPAEASKASKLGWKRSPSRVARRRPDPEPVPDTERTP